MANLAVHLPAFFRTAATEFGAFLAVLVLMLSAFLRAGVTGIGANTAKHSGMCAAKAH